MILTRMIWQKKKNSQEYSVALEEVALMQIMNQISFLCNCFFISGLLILLLDHVRVIRFAHLLHL